MAGEIEWCCIMCEDEESLIWMMLAAGDDLWYHPNFSRSKIWHKIMLHSFTGVRHGIIPISSRVSSQNKHKLQQKLLCPSCVCLQINYVFLSTLAFKALSLNAQNQCWKLPSKYNQDIFTSRAVTKFTIIEFWSQILRWSIFYNIYDYVGVGYVSDWKWSAREMMARVEETTTLVRLMLTTYWNVVMDSGHSRDLWR